ncbi:MAG: hypothetical protein AB1715_09180 [Acidobacteriota bacterium]
MPAASFYSALPLILLALLATPQEMPDFGPDGLAGITEAQKQQLYKGKIILPDRVVLTPDGKRIVEAAIIFNQPPDKVWSLLSKTEDQSKYLDEVKKSIALAKSPSADLLEIHTRILTKTMVYRLIHRFDKSSLYFYWRLDPSFKSEVRKLDGFWRFYPLADGRTLARYGSYFSLGFGVPEFIVTSLTKKSLPKALLSVKKYVDSGGTWDKNQN